MSGQGASGLASVRRCRQEHAPPSATALTGNARVPPGCCGSGGLRAATFVSLGWEVTGSRPAGRGGGKRGDGTDMWAWPLAVGPAMAKGQRAPCGPRLETKLGTIRPGDRHVVHQFSSEHAGSLLREGLESAHGRETAERPADNKLKLRGLFSHSHCLPVKKTQKWYGCSSSLFDI